jgi:hypothetical protein
MMTNTENVTPAGGDGGQPTPGTSQAAGAPPSSVDVNALAAALEPTLKRMVEQQWQSGKDSRIAKLTGEVDSFKSQMTRMKELMGKGFTEEGALEIMAAQAQNQPQAVLPQAAPPVSPGSETKAPGVDTDTLALLGLTINDPDVVELIRQGKLGNDDFIRLAKDRKARAVQPNPAAVVPTTQGVTAGGEDDLETIGRQLEAMRRLPPYQIDKAKYDDLHARFVKLAQQKK